MIKIENVEVFGWDAAIRGMRNPMNSWDKSDSYWTYIEDAETLETAKYQFFAGENDLKLMKSLAQAGDDHGKVTRFLDVYVDITAPLYWWKEFRTYRKGRKFMDDGDEFTDPDELEFHIETNSCSTMHKIHAKEFTLDDFSYEHLFDGIDRVEGVDDMEYYENPTTCLEYTVDVLNHYRKKFIETKDKRYWWQIIQLLPSSYNQKRTVKLNYQVLKNMYHARKNHKLDEWREFCKWCETLPYFSKICIDE